MGNLLRRARFDRRPVSSRRRWVGLLGLLLLISLIVAYQVLTRPQRIRGFAEAYLEKMSGGIVRIQSVRFDLFEGLHLTGVSVATHDDPAFPVGNRSYEDRVIFSSRELYLRLRPFGLITGNLVVPEILAHQPTLRLLRDPGTDLRNWQFLRVDTTGPKRPSRKNPTIRLRGAAVELAWSRASKGRVPSQFSLDVTAAPQAGPGSLYDVRWRTRAEPIENGRFLLDMTTLELRTAEGGLPTIPVASVRWAAPLELEKWIEILDLQGQVRTDSLSYDPTRGSSAVMTLHNAGLAVPANEQDRATPRDQRYLRFTKVEGRLVFEGPTVTLSLSGTWRGGICSLSGRVFADVATMQSLDDLGFDLNLQGENILLPAAPALQSPEEARFVGHWPRLMRFCETYSPDGRADLAFSMAKEPGRGRPLRFRGGRLVAKGASAAYEEFPYRLSDLRGTVHFAPDGNVRFDHLTGRHGGAIVIVNGTLTAPTHTAGVNLHIEGLGVELDQTLHDCLTPAYRQMWDRFAPRGFANIQVSLRRSDISREPSDDWTTHVVADLLDVEGCYDLLPLAVTDVRGQIQVAGDQFFANDVRGRYRDASWSLSGLVTTPPDRPPHVHLDVTAAGVPIDDRLTTILLPDAAGLAQGLQARGDADIEGGVHSAADATLGYDLTAKLRLASLHADALPLNLTNAEATARILPGRIEVEQFRAACLSGEVTLQAMLPLAPGTGPLWVEAALRHIALSQELFDVLPARAQRAWQTLRPAGFVDADLLLERPAAEADGAIRATVEVRPLEAAITPEAFPIEVSRLTGAFRLAGDTLRIANAKAAIGDAALSLDGSVDWREGGLTGEVRSRITGLALDERLRRALPWRMRRIWNAMQPKGALDLSFDRLAFRREADKPTGWTFDGAVGFRDVSLAGGALRDVNGTFEAKGTLAGSIADAGLDGRLNLSGVRFGSRAVSNIRSRIVKEPSDATLRLDDLEGDLYGGTAAGFGELSLGPDRTTYGLSVVVRNVSLSEFLAAGRSDTAGPVGAHGVIGGTLFLNGAFGDPDGRRGGGQIQIANAQVAKIPLLLAIIGPLNLAPVDENAFNDGTADFTLQGSSLTLGLIDLRGTSVSLVGAGRMDIATRELDLTLLAGSPHRLPRFGLLTELAEGAARELMEARVTGTLDEPRIEARPLRSLRRMLDAIGALRVKPKEGRGPRPQTNGNQPDRKQE